MGKNDGNDRNYGCRMIPLWKWQIKAAVKQFYRTRFVRVSRTTQEECAKHFLSTFFYSWDFGCSAEEKSRIRARLGPSNHCLPISQVPLDIVRRLLSSWETLGAAKMTENTSLNLPRSNSVVEVHIIDTTTQLVVPSKAFIQPVLKGHETLNFPDLPFLCKTSSCERTSCSTAGAEKTGGISHRPRLKRSKPDFLRWRWRRRWTRSWPKEASIPISSTELSGATGIGTTPEMLLFSPNLSTSSWDLALSEHLCPVILLSQMPLLEADFEYVPSWCLIIQHLAPSHTTPNQWTVIACGLSCCFSWRYQYLCTN